MSSQSELPTGFGRWAIVFAAVLGAAVFDLTWLIVGVALPYMQGAFSSTPDQIAWVMTAFIVGGMMMNAVTGWASTRFGRKQLFVLAIGGNAVTTLMCGLADSLAAEVLWRFLQGVTTVPLLALGQGIVLDVFPQDKRAFAIGMFGACTVGVAVFAPLFGGYLVEHYTWRWVFFINVPVAGVATVCALAFIPRDEPNTGRAFEWWGFLALMALVAALNLSLSRGQRLDWLDSTEIRIEFVIAALALIIVAMRTIYIQNSFLERRLFTDRNFLLSINVMLMFGALGSLPLILMPLMLQQVFGYPAVSAGALLLARGVGLIISMLAVGYMRRVDPRLILALGFFCAAVSNLYMSTWSTDINPRTVFWTNMLLGVAAGAIFVPMVTIALATLKRSLHTEALTFLFLVTNTGKAIGVAAIFVLHTRLLQINQAVLSENVTATSERLRHIAMPEIWDLDTLGGLATLSAEIGRQAELIAYLNDFLVTGVICLGILPLIAFLKKPPAPEEKEA